MPEQAPSRQIWQAHNQERGREDIWTLSKVQCGVVWLLHIYGACHPWRVSIMLLINILSRSLHKGRNTVILHGWAIAFISEDLLKINTPSLYISCNCQHLKMQSDKFWHNTWKILYVNILKWNLTLRPSHLKASPLTPSSWASCCVCSAYQQSILYITRSTHKLSESGVSFWNRKVFMWSQTVYAASLQSDGAALS